MIPEYQKIRRPLRQPYRQQLFPPERFQNWEGIMDAWVDQAELAPYQITVGAARDPELLEDEIFVDSKLLLDSLDTPLLFAVMYYTAEITLSCVIRNPWPREYAPEDWEEVHPDDALPPDHLIAYRVDTELIQPAWDELPGLGISSPSVAVQIDQLYGDIMYRITRLRSREWFQMVLISMQMLMQLLYLNSAPEIRDMMPRTMDDVNRLQRWNFEFDLTDDQRRNIALNIIQRLLISLQFCSAINSSAIHHQRPIDTTEVHPTRFPLLAPPIPNEQAAIRWFPRISSHGDEEAIWMREDIDSLVESVENLYANWWYLMEQKLPIRDVLI